MSLASLLLGTAGATSTRKSKGIVDSDLDSLFRANASSLPKRPSAVFIDTPGSSKDGERKRKLAESDERDPGRSKKSKAGKDGTKTKSFPISNATETLPDAPGPPIQKSSKRSQNPRTVEKKKNGKGKEVEPDANSEDDRPDLEDNYFAGKAVTENITAPSEPDDPDDDDASHLVHESLKKGGTARDKGSRSSGKAKYVPPEETSEQRDARTIFVGNLSVEVAQKRSLLKQLQRHILAHVPTAKIESTRFRSVPFQTPTSKLPTDDDTDPSIKSKGHPDTSIKQSRPHDRERTSTWRQSKVDEEDSGKSDEKKFLNPKEKKKIAFINHDFHSSADTVNAYVVFSHPQPAANRPANVPPPPPTLNPYEAARSAVDKCDGTLFMERMIRVDHVSKDVKREALGGEKISALDGDPKLTVFVGNLDFASKEEDLRVFFEGLVSAERGPPGVDDGEEEGGPTKPRTWVTRVRIVRDKETQMGKGFAYIQFADRECVDELLALEESKLKFAKRKLRVQRCKSFPGQSSTPNVRPDPNKLPASSKPKLSAPKFAAVPVVPRGDPSLGEKLAHLSKDARKQLKSTDADRVARRLAKKKARNALAKKGVKPQVKDRDRVRKVAAVKNSGAPRKKESKGRVRSEKSVAKRNTKK